MSNENRHVWKSRDRECEPCPECGTELYEQFWGNGGWVRVEKATEKAHQPRACAQRARELVAALQARVAALEAESASVREMFQETRRRVCRAMGVEEGKSWSWLESETASREAQLKTAREVMQKMDRHFDRFGCVVCGAFDGHERDCEFALALGTHSGSGG